MCKTEKLENNTFFLNTGEVQLCHLKSVVTENTISMSSNHFLLPLSFIPCFSIPPCPTSTRWSRFLPFVNVTHKRAFRQRIGLPDRKSAGACTREKIPAGILFFLRSSSSLSLSGYCVFLVCFSLADQKPFHSSGPSTAVPHHTALAPFLVPGAQTEAAADVR